MATVGGLALVPATDLPRTSSTARQTADVAARSVDLRERSADNFAEPQLPRSVPDAPASAGPAAATVAGESVIAPPPATFDAPPAPPAQPPALLHAAANPPSDGVWAVVIGIDDYPGSRSDLRASVYDADVVDYTLASYGVPGSRRLVLRNTQATAAVIEQSMRWLVANAGKDATAVFFYAGHVRKHNGGEAMVGADGRLVSDRTMGNLLRPLAAKTWIVMAACYAGGFTEALAPNRILTGASPRDALAYENAAYRNSYLVEFLFDRAMMQGHAPDTVERAYAWAYAAMKREHPNRLPVQYDQVPGELRLGTPPRSSAPPPPPPSEPPPSNPPPSTPPPGDDDDPDEDGPCLLTIRGLAGCA